MLQIGLNTYMAVPKSIFPACSAVAPQKCACAGRLLIWLRRRHLSLRKTATWKGDSLHQLLVAFQWVPAEAGPTPACTWVPVPASSELCQWDVRHALCSLSRRVHYRQLADCKEVLKRAEDFRDVYKKYLDHVLAHGHQV